MHGLFSDFFNPYQDKNLIYGEESLAVSNIRINNVAITPENNNSKNIIINSENNSLIIPALGLSTPVIIAQSTDKKALADDLDKGAVYYPGSVLPGQNGQMVILGHSAPPNWPKIKHDWIFSDINNLNMEDQITLNFNNTQYVYKFKDKKIIKVGDDISNTELSKTNNILTLVSCWPPGKDYQRIAITAELVRN